jgi:hypothetical protein
MVTDEIQCSLITFCVKICLSLRTNFWSYRVHSHSKFDPSSNRNQCGWKTGRSLLCQLQTPIPGIFHKETHQNGIVKHFNVFIEVHKYNIQSLK